jgi:hypothetical protein
VASAPARLSFVPCPVRVLTHTLTVRRGHRARLPFVCPRGCDDDWELDYRGHSIGLVLMLARPGVKGRTAVEPTSARLPPRARRITATLRPDTFSTPSHPRAKPQTPIRIVVRLRR